MTRDARSAIFKKVLTPGKNEKAYLAGTLDARDGTVLWVGAATKNSELFVEMLERLDAHYREARVGAASPTRRARAVTAKR